MKYSPAARRSGLVALAFFVVCVLHLQSQMPSSKVNNFLKSLPTFTTIDLTRAALQNLRFTEAENRELEAALRHPSYRAEIDRLLGTAKVPPGPTLPPPKSIETYRQEQTNRIAQISQRARNEAQQLMSTTARAAAGRSIVTASPSITPLAQTTIEPGQSLIIRGTNFLPQGTVMFTFGSSVFTGAIEYWANDFILTNLPADIQGVPETDGNVTVRRSDGRRADTPIRFVPIWEYQTLTSNRMTYVDNPYDGVVAFFLYVVKGIDEWCSQYNIPWPSTFNPLRNTWRITGVRYVLNGGGWLRFKNEDPAVYVGATTLPTHTIGSICFYILREKRLNCLADIKGPRGLKFYQ